MESEIKYIDELTKNALKNYAVKSDVTWNEFHQMNFGKFRSKTNFIHNNGIKKIAVTVVSLSIATAGVLLYTGGYDTDEAVIDSAYEKNSIYSNDTLNTKQVYVVEEQKEVIDTKNNIKKEDVIIKIKVPIHKKVEVRKQIILNDSISK